MNFKERLALILLKNKIEFLLKQDKEREERITKEFREAMNKLGEMI